MCTLLLKIVTGYTAVVTIVVTIVVTKIVTKKIVTNSNKKIVTKIIIQKLW